MTIEQNDPTASGFTPPSRGEFRLSGNETEMLCLKAARGAGLPWGLAEEAGFAARWLQTRGLDGPSALLAHLDWLARRDFESVQPVSPDALRPRGTGALCPITAGATLSDRAALPERPVGPVAAPILLLPFLHCLARSGGKTIVARWRDGMVSLSSEGSVSGDVDLLARLDAATVELTYTEEPETESRGTHPDRRPTPACLGRLNDYAMNITVPASGSSRVEAGAASDDND